MKCPPKNKRNLYCVLVKTIIGITLPSWVITFELNAGMAWIIMAALYEIKPKPGSKDSILYDIVFEMEPAKQVEVNIDYILMLVKKYHCKMNKKSI